MLAFNTQLKRTSNNTKVIHQKTTFWFWSDTVPRGWQSTLHIPIPDLGPWARGSIFSRVGALHGNPDRDFGHWAWGSTLSRVGALHGNSSQAFHLLTWGSIISRVGALHGIPYQDRGYWPTVSTLPAGRENFDKFEDKHCKIFQAQVFWLPLVYLNATLMYMPSGLPSLTTHLLSGSPSLTTHLPCGSLSLTTHCLSSVTAHHKVWRCLTHRLDSLH